MRARVLVATGSDDIAERVRSMSSETESMALVGRAADSAETVDALRRTDVDVLLLDVDLGPLSVVELARSIGASFPFVGIVVLASTSSPLALRAAIDCGARGVLNLPLAFEELEANVGAAAEWAEGVRDYAANPRLTSMPTRGATMIGVAGGKGGAGTSTVALHLALAVAQHSQASKQRRLVCLVDLSETGDARLRLDIYARRDLLDLAQVSRELSVRHLEEALYIHHTGLRVLLGPEQAEFRDEIDPGATRAILGALAASHEVVIVDLGVGTSRSALAAAELADDVVVVATPDVVSIRAANRLAALWERTSARTGEVKLLLNRASRRSEVQPDLLAKASQVGVTETRIPANFKELEGPLNSGAPETLSDRGLLRAFLALADELDILEDPQEALEARGERDGERERTWWQRARPQGNSGFIAVDAIFAVLLLGFFGLIMLQFMLTGVTFILAGHAADRAAKAQSLGLTADVGRAARADLPGAWTPGVVQPDGRSAVTVSLRVPSVVPGLRVPLDISSTSHAISEPGITEPGAVAAAAR